MSRDYQNCRAWLTLAERAVQHADAAWWHETPVDLVECARRSRIGRRMLAERLAASVAPNLFGLLRPLTADERRRCKWLFEPVPSVRETITDLGALSLSPAIRQTVDGDSVGRLRDALSAERYVRIMSSPDPWRDHVPRDVRRSGASALCRSAGSAGELLRLVHGVGLREISGFVRGIHAGLQELLRLCFPPDLEAAGPGPWLPTEAIAACLYLDRDASAVSP